jgi:mono/diheme cytochrome c family protein
LGQSRRRPRGQGGWKKILKPPNPERGGAAFNLRKFPPDQRERFVNAVTRGKNQMPPWGDFFKPDQLQALWAYVMAGER